MLSSLLRRRVIGRFPPSTSAARLGPQRRRIITPLPLALEPLEDRVLLRLEVVGVVARHADLHVPQRDPDHLGAERPELAGQLVDFPVQCRQVR